MFRLLEVKGKKISLTLVLVLIVGGFLGLNFSQDCFAISRDITKFGYDVDFRFKG